MNSNIKISKSFNVVNPSPVKSKFIEAQGKSMETLLVQAGNNDGQTCLFWPQFLNKNRTLV